MKLSEADWKVIHRLRKNEASWIVARWFTLFVGVVMFSGSAFMFQQIWSTVASDKILIVLCLLIAPLSGVALVAGLAAILNILAFWNGRPTNKLLLRLADEVESDGK